jgi:hypothetical protein
MTGSINKEAKTMAYSSPPQTIPQVLTRPMERIPFNQDALRIHPCTLGSSILAADGLD